MYKVPNVVLRRLALLKGLHGKRKKCTAVLDFKDHRVITAPN